MTGRPRRLSSAARSASSLRALAAIGVSWCLACSATTAVAQRADSAIPKPAVLQPLRVGLAVTAKPAGGVAWDINIFEDGQIGSHLVVEVGVEHVVVQDLSGLTRTWIPLSAIRSVSWTKALPAGSPPMPGMKLPPPVGWPSPRP